MKKYITLLFATLLLASCVETSIDAGGTSVEKMAGHWTVTVDVVDASGNVVDTNIMGHHTNLFTFNTAANKPTEMWITDKDVDASPEFWDYKLKVDVNYAARTFTTNGAKDNVAYDCQVNIENGKVVEGGTKTPSGMPADYIEFFVSFSDDKTPYGTIYKVSGFRYTGFPADY